MQNFQKCWAALSLLSLSTGAVHALSFDVVPEHPRAYEAIHIVINPSSCDKFLGVEVRDGRIGIMIEPVGVCGLPHPGPQVLVPLGRLPAGEWTLGSIDGGYFSPVRNLVVSESDWFEDATESTFDVSGNWGIVGRSGHGVKFTQSSTGVLAGLVFTYLSTREPEWFTLQAPTPMRNGHWEGEALRTTGNPNASYEAPTYERIAMATIDFLDPENAQLCFEPVSPTVPDDCFELIRFPMN